MTSRIKKRCVICGKLADVEYDVRPYKNAGVCCGECYEKYVTPAKKRAVERMYRK